MDHASTNRRKPPKPVKPVKLTNLKASVATESARNPGPTVWAPARSSRDWDKYSEGQEAPKVILKPVKDQVLESGSGPPTPVLSKTLPRRASSSIVPVTLSHVAESLQAIPVPILSTVQSELDEVEKESRELAARLQLLNLRKQRLEEEKQEQEKIERERAALARAEAERKEAERKELERQEEERQMLQRLQLEKQRQEEEERLKAEQVRLKREKLIQQRMELRKQEQLLREMEQTLQRDGQEDESLAKGTQRYHMNLQKPASDQPVGPPKKETAGKAEQQKVVESEVTETSEPTVNQNPSFNRRRDESEQFRIVDAERPPGQRQESYKSDRNYLSPSLKSPASQPQSPSNSSTHSRQTSFGSARASSLSTQTDEDLAWELAAEVDIQDVNLTDLHPILYQQMQEALHRHMPPEHSATLEDTEGQPPPVPPKESPSGRHPPVKWPLSEEVPAGETPASDPRSNQQRGRILVRPPTPGPSKERPSTSRSRPFKDFDSDTGADTIDEDRCFCGKARPSVEECYFCWPCDGTIFCKECWDNCPPHKKKRMRAAHAGAGLPHEKTNPAVARKIFYTLQSDHDSKEQALQHVKDEDTSWFGTGRDEQDDVVFQDFGRYARLMAEKSARHRRVRYPALVSFVGQTGAGKSSLIRLLIELHAPAGSKSQVPVVGSNLHQDVPTSGDVHLYADPNTFEGDLPILYADCEGLDGGEREPMGARARNKKDVSDKRTHSFIKQIRKQHHTSEREIVWAITPKTRSREYHVRNLYPRLLYTFSDVIVFVTKNPRVIENVIEQLIRWAAAALETSSNQPLLPHAIIVFNASDNATDPILWDVNQATISLMDSVRRAVHQNHNMRKFAEFWRQKGKPVESVEMLLLSYYSSIRVVRVPERGRPNLINGQLQKLYQEIADTCEHARESKHKVRMLLNSDELQPYLQYAFDHFSRDLERPFDFVQASFTNNPIPSNFGGNVLKMAINIMEVWKDKLDGPSIFKELSFMVASCIMLDSSRHRTLGPADKVFPGYIEYCDDALDEFCNRHWPCEYVHPNTRGRCVNVKAGHQSKGHQLVNGRVLAVGEYESTFTTENYRDFFRYGVYFSLARLLEKLQEATKGSLHPELQKAAEIHRDSVLKPFYTHLSGAKAFISHTACFSCLITPPEHALPCGHVLCTPCIQSYGLARGKYIFEMAFCPLHPEEDQGQFQPKWPVQIKPPGAGIRIMSLDGGGVRGIIELMILQEIERNLGPGLPIQAFIDLIVGTSTGGIIALGLGANGWSVQKCIHNFERLCDKAFTRRRGVGIPGIEFFISASNHSRYETQPIEKALKDVFGEHNLFAGAKHDFDDRRIFQRLTKVAVTTTTTAGTVALLANYNRIDTEENPAYQFHRSEKPPDEIKTWQAARATSAAPTMFKPFAHDPSGQVYQDGALYYNCPVEIAIREHRLVWPDAAEHPDIVLSLGTGVNPNSRSKPLLGARPSRWGLVSEAKALAKIAIDHIQSSLNSQQTWETFLTQKNPPVNLRDRYIRLNLGLDKDPPKMDDVRALPELRELTRSKYTSQRDYIKTVADRLLATCFFFVQDMEIPVNEHEDNSITISGTIMCRFATGSDELLSLGEALRTRSKKAYNENYAQHNPYFVIREKHKELLAQQVILGAEEVDYMRNDGTFSPPHIQVHLSDKRVETEIAFCFADHPDRPLYSISGFPRCLMEDVMRAPRRMRSTANRKKNATFDADWASFEAKKTVWKFSVDDITKAKDPVEQFSSSTYVNPGNTTSDTISRIYQRYSSISDAETLQRARSSENAPPLPTRPSKYHSPESVSANTGDDLNDPLPDAENEHLRQQLLYLLLRPQGREKPPPYVPPRQGPLYIPTLAFENRATKQRVLNPGSGQSSTPVELDSRSAVPRLREIPGVHEMYCEWVGFVDNNKGRGPPRGKGLGENA